MREPFDTVVYVIFREGSQRDECERGADVREITFARDGRIGSLSTTEGSGIVIAFTQVRTNSAP